MMSMGSSFMQITQSIEVQRKKAESKGRVDWNSIMEIFMKVRLSWEKEMVLVSQRNMMSK